MSIVAPPPVIPPEQDQLEALIREARARQRRRRLLGAATLAVAAGAALSVHSVLAGSGWTSTRAGRNSSAALPTCRLADLRVQRIPISNPTGLDRLGLQFTNRLTSSCRVSGYPRLHFRDPSGTMPFLIRRLGEPRSVTLRGRQSTFSIFSKFRCDLGGGRSATKTVVSLPGDHSTVAFTGGPGICRPGIPAEGRWVTLTPFESLQAAYRTSLIGNGSGP
jgi:hypothetical protein